jgi:predicted RNA-binding protein with PUA-like domain
MAYWILRSEPETYGWPDLVRDSATEWDGVRNYTARNFLKDMAVGDEALFYHSGKEKAAVGVMEITRAWKPDGADGRPFRRPSQKRRSALWWPPRPCQPQFGSCGPH